MLRQIVSNCVVWFGSGGLVMSLPSTKRRIGKLSVGCGFLVAVDKDR